MSADAFTVAISGNSNDTDLILHSANSSIYDTDPHSHHITDLSGHPSIEAQLVTNTNKIAALETSLATNLSNDLLQLVDISLNADGVLVNSQGVATNSQGVATNSQGVATNSQGVAANLTRLDVHESLVLKNISNIEAVNAGLGGQSTVTILDASNNLNIIGTQEVFLLDCILDSYAVDPNWGEGILEIWEYGSALGSVNSLLKRIVLNSIRDKMVSGGLGNTYKFSTKLVLPALKTYFIRFIDTYGDGVTGDNAWPTDENGNELPALTLSKQDGTIVHRVPRQTNYNVYWGALPTHDPSFGTTWQAAADGSVYIDSDTFPYPSKFQLDSFEYVLPNKTDRMVFGRDQLEAVPSVLLPLSADETFLENLETELAALTPNTLAYFNKSNERYWNNKRLGRRLDMDPKEDHWSNPMGLGSWGFSGQSVELNQKTYYLSSIIYGILFEYDNVTKTNRSIPLVTEINNNEAMVMSYGNAGRVYLTGDQATNSLYLLGTAEKIKNGLIIEDTFEPFDHLVMFKVTQEVDANGVGRLPTFTATSNNYFDLLKINDYTRVDDNNVKFTWPPKNNGTNLVPLNNVTFNSYNNLIFGNPREFRVLNNELILLHTSSKVKGLKGNDDVGKVWAILNKPETSTLFDIPQTKLNELANYLLVTDTSGVFSLNSDFASYDSTDLSGTVDFITLLNTTYNISKEKAIAMKLFNFIEDDDNNILTKFNMTNQTFKQTKFFDERLLESDMLDGSGNQQYTIEAQHRGTIELIEDLQNNIWVVGYGRIKSGPTLSNYNDVGFWNIPANFENHSNINAISGLMKISKDGYNAQLFWNAGHIAKTKNNAFVFNSDGCNKIKADFTMLEQPTKITTGALDLKYYFSHLNKANVIRGSYQISDTQAMLVMNLSPSWGSEIDWQTFNLKENGHSVVIIVNSATNSIERNFFLKSSLEDYNGTNVVLPVSMHARNFEAIAYDFVNKKLTFLPSFFAINKINPSATQEPRYHWYPADYNIDLTVAASLKSKDKVENKVPRKALKPRKQNKGLDQYL